MKTIIYTYRTIKLVKIPTHLKFLLKNEVNIFFSPQKILLADYFQNGANCCASCSGKSIKEISFVAYTVTQPPILTMKRCKVMKKVNVINLFV